MTWPHTSEFRRGAQIIFWVSTAAGVLGTLVPGEPAWQRIASIPYAFVMVGGGFAAGWLVAHFWRLTLGWIAPSLAYRLSVLYFYGAPLSAVLLPLLSTYDAAGLEGQGVSLREMILYVPASLGVSAGVRHALNQYVVAV